jgi:hypothetical protein
MRSLGLCPQLSKVRFPVVDSNVPSCKLFCCFKLSFRMMSVLAYIPIHFSVGHLLYTSVSLVSLPFYSLLWLWSLVELDFPEFYTLRWSFSDVGWLISLTLIPVSDIHSSWVCYPYTGNTSLLVAFPRRVSLLDIPLWSFFWWFYPFAIWVFIPQYMHFRQGSSMWIFSRSESGFLSEVSFVGSWVSLCLSYGFIFLWNSLFLGVSPLLPQQALQSDVCYPHSESCLSSRCVSFVITLIRVVSCSRILFLTIP